MTDPRNHRPDDREASDRRQQRRGPGAQYADFESWTTERYQIRRSVRCRRCSYDLRGLEVDGRCPECGLEIWPSVMHMIDPAATKLPKLRDPPGVGDGLVWLFVCALAAALALAANGAMLLPNVLPPSGVRVAGLRLPTDLLLVSGVIGLAGLWSAWKFMPPRGDGPNVTVRRDVWLLVIALLIWAAVCFGLWDRERIWVQMGLLPDAKPVIAVRALAHVGLAVAATLALYSMRRLLDAIGSRSREYRRARGGRQRIRPMIVSALGVAAGSVVRYLSTLEPVPEMIHGLGLMLVGVSMIMLLIGLGYLLVNAWWIRRVLRKPPPQLRDLLQPLPGGSALSATEGGESEAGQSKDDPPPSGGSGTGTD